MCTQGMIIMSAKVSKFSVVQRSRLVPVTHATGVRLPAGKFFCNRSLESSRPLIFVDHRIFFISLDALGPIR